MHSIVTNPWQWGILNTKWICKSDKRLNSDLLTSFYSHPLQNKDLTTDEKLNLYTNIN